MENTRELTDRLAQIDREIRIVKGNRQSGLAERRQALQFTNDQIAKDRAAGAEAKLENDLRVKALIEDEIAALEQKLQGLEAQRSQVQQQLDQAKAAAPVPKPAEPENTPKKEPEKPDVRGASAQRGTPVADNDVAKPEPALKTDENAAKAVTRDDSVQPATNNQQPITSEPVGSEYYNRFKIKPQPNILDNFYNYTYTASVYLMTEVQYRRLLQSASKNIDGWQLLFQSAGIQNNSNVPPSANTPGTVGTDGERSLPAVEVVADRFPSDYYIDSIVFENAVPGKATGAAHMVSNLTFTVIEPSGITLLDKLAAKVKEFRTPEMQGKPVNYATAFYVMVIRWFGYDENGKQVQVTGGLVDQEGVSQPGAIVERFIPFRIKNIKFAVTNALVTYTWECAVFGQLLGAYTGRGTVPADIELSATTVGEILGGLVGVVPAGSTGQAAADNRAVTTTVWGGIQRQSDVRDSEAPAAGTIFTPQVPNASGNQTITRNLVKFLNDYQANLVRKGIFDKADQYEIVFLGNDANDLFGARLQLLDKDISKRRTAAGIPINKSADGLSPDKGYVDLKTRNSPIVAGMSIVQVIDLLIRNSTYIGNQSLLIYDENGLAQPNKRKNAPLKWFNISMHAVPLEWDNKRNDHAYKIVYSISSRLVKNVVSRYFVSRNFDGVVKRYPYWFTGQNTAVLDYREDLNTLYQFTVSGGRDAAGKEIESARDSALQKGANSLLDLATFVWQPRSSETSAGAEGPALENAANFAEQLYSPGDLREATIRILGDPAWIAQGSVLRAPNNEMFSGTSVEQGFLADGTIAFENQDVLFEVVWQKPDDYDIGTGLADPYLNSNAINRNPLQSRIFLCKKVVTELVKGKFEQVLYGAQLIIPVDIPGSVEVQPLTPSDNQRPISAIDPNDRNAAAFGRQINPTASGSGGSDTAVASGAKYSNAAAAAPEVKNVTATDTTATAGRIEGPGISLALPPKAPTDGSNNSVAGNASKGPSPNLAALQARKAQLQREYEAIQAEFGSGKNFKSGAAEADREAREIAKYREIQAVNQQMARES